MGENTELAQLANLLAFGVSDTGSGPEFDRLTAIAARLLQAPVSLLSFFDDDYQWIKSAVGTEIRQLPREITFCHHMLDAAEPKPLVVLDMLEDDRFRQSPLVMADPNVRFYAGVPLTTHGGTRLGSLCVVDFAPRSAFAPEDIGVLTMLADMAAELLQSRQQAMLRAEASQRALLADAMLTVIAGADGCASALDAAGRVLATDLGASMRQVWMYRAPFDRTVCVSAHYDTPADACMSAGAVTEAWPEGLVETAIWTDRPVSVAVTAPGALAADPLLAEAAACGLDRLVALPIAVGADHFAMILGFGADEPGPADLVASLSSLPDLLQPGLDRKAAEARYRLLSTSLDMSTDGVSVMELDPVESGSLRLTYVNKRLCALTGHSAVGIVGQPPSILEAPGSEAIGKQLESALRRGYSRPTLLTMSRSEGTPPQIEMGCSALRDHQGRVTHLVSIYRDVTKRLKKEREQEALTDSFRLLFDRSPLPMWIFDKRTMRFLMVNDAAVRFYGWSREQFLQMGLPDVRPPSAAQELDGEAETDFVREAGSRLFTHCKADGTIVQMDVVAIRHPPLGEDAVFAAYWDMTAVQAARDELARSNELLSDLASQLKARSEELTDAHRLAQLGTWRLFPDGQTMTWSDEIYTLIGRDRADYPPSYENALELFHPDDRRLFLKPFDHVESGGTANRLLDARVIRGDGRIRRVKIEFRVSDDGSRAGYVQDWSERWDTEQALMRSEKLAILGQITGGVAHDFNNLLTVITLNLEESVDTLSESDELQDVLVPALNASRRCAELTNQLLSYARQAPLRPQTITLDGFFSSCRPMIRRTLGKNHDLVLTVADGRAAPLVDASQLQTALVNLALNARDAMPQGGSLRVEAAKATLPSADYDLEDAVAGDYAMISFTDTGSGIPPAIQARIFEPFFTTKEDGGNSGLGLSMVDGFVRQSGGYCQVRSKVGNGTTVRLFLPLSREDEARRALAPPRPRALLVDDQPAVLATVARMFNQLGYDACAVANAADALAELDRDRNFAVLFTDIVLPGGMDGFALSKIVRSRAPDIRILLTSGYNEQDLSQPVLPGVDILAKPYKRKDLLDRLTAIMA